MSGEKNNNLSEIVTIIFYWCYDIEVPDIKVPDIEVPEKTDIEVPATLRSRTLSIQWGSEEPTRSA